MALVLNGDGNVTGLTPGGLPDASITQADLAANIAGNGPAFLVYKNTNQTSIGATVSTKISFQAKTFDTHSFFDASTNYRFQPTIAGYYQISSGVCIPDPSSSAYVQVDFIVSDGTKNKSGATGLGVNSVLYPRSVLSALIYFNGTTDYLEAYVYGGAGSTYSLLAGQTQTWMSGYLAKAA